MLKNQQASGVVLETGKGRIFMAQVIRVLIVALAVFVAGCASIGMTEQWPWYYEDSPFSHQTETIER